MTKDKTIQAVKNADISSYGWDEEIITQIESKYAQGYINARTEHLLSQMSSSDEEYRDELLTILDYNIWK